MPSEQRRPPPNTAFLPPGGLRVRHEAATLARLVYAAADELPHGRRGDLADQMRRAATSVYANLSEGEGKRSPAERSRFFEVAWGSLRELESHLHLAASLHFIPAPRIPALRSACRHVGRMLHALLRR